MVMNFIFIHFFFSLFYNIVTHAPNLKKEDDRINTSPNSKSPDINTLIDFIYKELRSKQYTDTTHFQKFPPHLAHDKGLYPSFIHINWMDATNSFLAKIIRTKIQVPDSNNFVTSFVAYAILDTFQYGGISKIDIDEIANALEGLRLFQDKNSNETIPIYTFWKQIHYDKIWMCYPENMVKIVDNFPQAPAWLIETLKKLGFKKFAENLELFNGLANTFLYAYRIPPDIDDTSVNMGLTALLHKLRPQLNEKIDSWLEINQDYKTLFDKVKYYAYRPFANMTSSENGKKFNNNSNLIDARTYYFIHPYLTEKKQNLTQEELEKIILPSTWLYDVDTSRINYPYTYTPLAVNNVDLNVAGNFLFGLTNLLHNHKNQTYVRELFDLEIRQIYQNTVDLLEWAIKFDITNKRWDLALLYYPSIYDVYWLMSRTYSTLKSLDSNLNLIEGDDDIREFLRIQRLRLEKILREEGTQQILGKRIKTEHGYKFHEFLGNYANYSRDEDAMFSTGLALNTFLNIWTDSIYNSETLKYSLKWVDETPLEVINTTDLSVDFILNQINYHYIFTSLEGAFFSGSVKSIESNPWVFPSNYNEYFNHTKVGNITDPLSVSGDLVSGIEGYLSEEEYSDMTKKIYYGNHVPVNFTGVSWAPFAYWSSPSMTLSVNLLGLTKYRTLQK
jgi:hypothetical protein